MVILFDYQRRTRTIKTSADKLLSIKEIGKNPSESKKEIMEITKDKLFSAIADLVNLVMEHSNDSSEIVYILKKYGFTNEQIAEWYALDTGK